MLKPDEAEGAEEEEETAEPSTAEGPDGEGDHDEDDNHSDNDDTEAFEAPVHAVQLQLAGTSLASQPADQPAIVVTPDAAATDPVAAEPLPVDDAGDNDDGDDNDDNDVAEDGLVPLSKLNRTVLAYRDQAVGAAVAPTRRARSSNSTSSTQSHSAGTRMTEEEIRQRVRAKVGRQRQPGGRSKKNQNKDAGKRERTAAAKSSGEWF